MPIGPNYHARGRLGWASKWAAGGRAVALSRPRWNRPSTSDFQARVRVPRGAGGAGGRLEQAALEQALHQRLPGGQRAGVVRRRAAQQRRHERLADRLRLLGPGGPRPHSLPRGAR